MELWERLKNVWTDELVEKKKHKKTKKRKGNKRVSQATKNKMKDLYEMGMSNTDISHEVGYSGSTVSNHIQKMKDAGIIKD